MENNSLSGGAGTLEGGNFIYINSCIEEGDNRVKGGSGEGVIFLNSVDNLKIKK